MKLFYFLLFALISLNSVAGSLVVYEKRVKADLGGAYLSVSKALEYSDFYVVFEVGISKNVANFAQKWNTDYNPQ